MDELLEVVSEAVSAMVLYTVEADERNTRVVDISEGAQVVKTAADFFVDMASKAAEFWVNFNRADMRDQMVNTGNEVRQATADILQAAQTLSADPFNKPGKKLLLKGAKNTMAHLVVLLQQADLYEVTRIIRACNRVTSKKNVVLSLPPGESYFAAGAQEMVTHTVDLAKATAKRIKEIDDFSLKRRFEDSSSSLRSQTDAFLQVMARVMRSDMSAPEEAQAVSAEIDLIIEEIILVTKLSAKSPFDLSMIEGLDLKDDDDLQDLAQLVKNNLNRLQRAIDLGDGKEASSILLAVKKGLNDLIAMNRALARNCDDPVRKMRYDAAAAQAQKTLDEVVPLLSEEVEKLLRGPSSNTALKRLNAMVEDLQRAAHAMVMATSDPSVEDLDAIYQNLGSPLQRLIDAVSVGNAGMMAQELDSVKQNVANQLSMADFLADHAIQEAQPYLHNVANAARQDIGNMLTEVEFAARQGVIDPANSKLLAALQASANALKSACAELVENMSVATPEEVLQAHQELAVHQKKLIASIMAGDKKQTIEAMRAIRKTLNHELELARAIARATNDPEMRDRLEAVCANAQRQIDQLMGQLGDLADMALMDPNNEDLKNKLEAVFGDANAISAKLVAACGQDLLIQSNKVLGDRLAELKDALEVPDPRAAVNALKAILGETTKQTDIARMMADNTDDEERATRIVGFADAMAAAAPVLVNAAKAVLTSDDPLLQTEVHKASIKVRDASNALLSAATLDDEEEFLHNATRIDADMARMLNGIELGLAPDVEQVADLVKKVSAQIKLGNAIAARSGNARTKDSLIKAGTAMSKLMALMVGAVRDGVENDPKNLEKLAGFLRDAIAMNRSTVADAFGLEDDMNTVTDDLNKNIAQLEKAFDHGTPAQLATALHKVQSGIAQQAFLAKIMASKTDIDPERKNQLLEAVEMLDGISKQLGPTLQHAKLNPNDAASQKRAQATLSSLKDGVQTLAAVGSGGTEGMANRAVALGQQMAILESAVKSNNPALANQVLTSVASGLKQQAQLAKANANLVQDPQARRALLEYADGLEKSVPLIQAQVKEALAKPADKVAQQKLSQSLATARTQLAGVTAALTPAHVQPVDNVNAIAQAMKKEIAELRAAIQSGDQKAAADAVLAAKTGAYAQQLELAKAYTANIKNPEQRFAVGDAIAELDKSLKDLLPAVEGAQAKPNDKATTQKVVPPADSALAALNSLLAASHVDSDDRVAAAAAAASALISQVETDVKNKVDPSASLAALKPALLQAAKAIRAAAVDAPNENKASLYQLADKIESSFPQFEAVARKAHAEPQNQDAQRALAASAAETRNALNKAVAQATPSPQEHAARLAAAAAADIDRLTTAIESGDVAAAEKAVAQLRGPVQANLEILKAIAEQSGDPAAAASAAKALGLIPQLVTASVGAIKNPADKNQKAKVAELAAATKQALAEAVASYPNTDELLVANAEKVNASLAKLATSAKSGDTVGANAALEAAQDALSQQSLLARVVAHQAATPEAKSAILKDAESVDKILPELAIAGKAAIAKPQDAAAQQKLATVSTKAKDINKNLADHGRAAQQRRLEKARREQQEREERARKIIEEDSVETVSLVLNERTDKLKVDNTAEGKLFGTAKEISAALAALSKAAKTGDKKGMIEAARELTRASQLYVSQAAVAAEKCTEPKLKEQILTNAQAAKNWSVQLKIIAAVKAASDEDTTQAKDQLLKCAKGVSKAVISTINSVEIAAVHKK